MKRLFCPKLLSAQKKQDSHYRCRLDAHISQFFAWQPCKCSQPLPLAETRNGVVHDKQRLAKMFERQTWETKRLRTRRMKKAKCAELFRILFCLGLQLMTHTKQGTSLHQPNFDFFSSHKLLWFPFICFLFYFSLNSPPLLTPPKTRPVLPEETAIFLWQSWQTSFARTFAATPCIFLPMLAESGKHNILEFTFTPFSLPVLRDTLGHSSLPQNSPHSFLLLCR